jgi:hypothetical protein
MAEISLTRLSGGNTPADGSDPRTFPAIWNASATAIEDALAEGGGGSITVSDTAPTDPAPGQGDLWWDSANGKLFVYYVDGDSSQWVDAAGPSVAVQSTAPTGYEGQLWLDDTDGSMYVYYTDPGGGASSWIGAVSRSGGILQVVSTTKTDTFSESLANNTLGSTVTGLTVDVTPRSTSSKAHITGLINVDGYSVSGFVLYRDSTAIAIGDAAGSRARLSAGNVPNFSNNFVETIPINYLDSPSTTSTVTYSIRLYNASTATRTLYLNRSQTDTDSAGFGRYASTITVMEIAG